MRLLVWYNNLTPLKQLGVSFLANCIVWLMASLLKDVAFYNYKHSLNYHVFDAIWMALFMSTLFNWNKIKIIKSVRSNPKKSKQSHTKDQVENISKPVIK